jgi:hypothetical protein
MSQITHPRVSLRTRVRAPRAAVLAGLLALVAAAAVALALTIGGYSNHSVPAPANTHALRPNVRYDGGPEEGSSAPTGPNVRYDGGPEEGSATRAISGR